MAAQAAVFKSEGAIGVGLVNAVRGAVITLCMHALFCAPARRNLCLTRQTLIAAVVTTLGGAIYVLAGGGRSAPPPKPAAAAAAAAGAAKGAAPAAVAAAAKDKEA